MQSAKKTVPVREALRAKAASAIEPQPPVAVDQAAIDKGRKPLDSRRKNVVALRAKAVELYGVPASGLAPIPAIESGFQFRPLESDADFSYLHVGPLLDQATVLLEGCAKAREQRDRLQVEKWNLQLELDRFFRLDQIQERERAAGLDTLPYQRAALESAAEQNLEANNKGAETHLKALQDDLVATGFNKRMAAHELSSWLSAFPLKDSDLRGDDALYTFDGAHKTKPDLLFDAARQEADEAAWEQFADLMAKRFASMGASEAARLRKESLGLQTNWELAGIGFRTDRSQAERDVLWERVFQAQAQGGLLNYSERIAPVERDFSQGFREALARLTVAQRGLKELYDYATPLPAEGTPGYLDEVALWARNAKNRMAQFTQMEQSYVLVASLKELTQSQWEAGRTASQWTFDITEELFPKQVHVRLRGLGLAVVGAAEPADTQKSRGAKTEAPAKPEGFWSAHLSLPPAAQVRYVSGASNELDQKALPPCYLGRVRDSSLEAEIASVNVLQNASPIGKQWKITLSPKSTAGTLSNSLQDVELYLHVAVRSRKVTS
jgi:hypothetical protein